MNMMTALPRPYVPAITFTPRRSPERFRRMVALFDRDEIEDAVEALIAYMDALDGDIDREDCGLEDDFTDHAASGPGCRVSDPDFGAEEQGEREEDGGEHLLPEKPIYGIDQSTGPINEREATINHQARLRGLIKTATGWRLPA